MKAVVMNGMGDSDVMEFVERPEPVATPGHVIVEVRVAGVNFMDIGVRQGMAWTETPNPKVLGVEGAGRVLSVGDGVTDLAVGDHVAWVYAPEATPSGCRSRQRRSSRSPTSLMTERPHQS